MCVTGLSIELPDSGVANRLGRAVTQYIAISKFGDALGVVLEPAFQGGEVILHVDHAG